MDLTEIVSELHIPADPRVIVGVDTSDDAGVFALDGTNKALIQTADFITPVCDDPYWYGRVAAANSLSDIYAMGGTPLTALNLCCFPQQGITKHDLSEILRGGLDTVVEAGAALVGGHTVKDVELKYGLSVTGIADRDRITPNSGARPGDRLILTKPVGTGVIISGYKNGKLSADTLMGAVRKMATLSKVAAQVMVDFGCKGATDITGFGLGGHAWEIAAASRVKLVFYADKVPFYQEALDMVRENIRTGVTKANGKSLEGRIFYDDVVPPEIHALFYDPQTSGGLLIAVPEAKADAMLTELKNRGVEDAALVGHVEQAERSSIYVRESA